MVLFLTVLTAAFGADGRLDGRVVPTAERLDLLVDPGESTYSGTAEIDLTVSEKLSSFQVHAEDLDLLEVGVRVGKKMVPATASPSGDGLVQITTAKPLKPGAATLVVKFENNFDTGAVGLYAFEHGGHRFVSSQMEADHARKAFPCFDEPQFKIPWTLTVEAPHGMQVIANTSVASDDESGGWRQLTFAPTPPMSSYLFALAVGPYEGVVTEIAREGAPPVPATLWGMPGTAHQTAFLADANARSLRYLEDYFGVPYPYEKLDWIVLPEHPYGAMENPGAVTSDAALAYVDPASADIDRLAVSAQVVAHEVGHMWFGDLVTLAWWDDFWLNEAFASWISHKTVDALWPQTESDFSRAFQRAGALSSDALASSRPLRTEVDPAFVFETSNVEMMYTKAPAVLAMTEAWLGEGVFREGVRAYMRTHAGGNATAADLFTALGKASGQDVQGVLKPYLDQPGSPMLAFTPADAGAKVSLGRFALFGSGTPDQGGWTVPVAMRYRDATGVHETTMLIAADGDLTFGEGAVQWVYPTIGGHGYFVWGQPSEAMQALLADAPKVLSPIERLSLVLDLGLLQQSGQVKLGTKLRWFTALEGETHPQVVAAMANDAEQLRYLVDEAQRDALAAYLRATFRPALDAIGLEPRPNDSPRTADLRITLLQTLADLGRDEALRAYGVEVGTRFLADDKAVPTPLGSWGLARYAEQADPTLIATLAKKLAATRDPDLRFAYLGAIGHVPGGREQALAMSLGPDLAFHERATLFGAVFRGAGREHLIDWAIANHDALVSLIPEPQRPALAWVANVCDAEVLEKAKAFYGDEARALPGTPQVLAELEDRVTACLAQRDLHKASVDAFLEAFADSP